MTIASKTTALLSALTSYGTADNNKAGTLVEKAQKAAANGVAPLDSNAKIPAIHLPSYVDDVLEYANTSNFPAFGESGKIYIAVNAGTAGDPTRQYRWTGTAYAEIVTSPGSTDVVTEGSTNLYFTATRVRAVALAGLSTATNAVITAADTVLAAFGKLQKQISDHFANTSNPHGTTKAQVGLGSADDTADINKLVASALRVRSGASAGGTAMVFTWSDPGGQPNYLWGGADGTNMYVYSRANMSVNYANGAGYATSAGSVGTVGGAAGGTITSDTHVNGVIRSVTAGFQWNGAATGMVPFGYASNGAYRQNPIVNCQNGQGDISDFSSYHQPGVDSFFQFNVGGSGNYFRMSNNGVASSNGGWTTHSDRRTKSKIRPITGALKKIRQLNGYTFVKNGSKPKWRKTPFRRMGYLAQEWLKVMPEAVDVPHDYDPETDSGGILSMLDASSTALLLEGIKEMDATLTAMRAEMHTLRNDNRKMKQTLAALTKGQ